MKVCDYQRSFFHFSIDTSREPAMTMSQPAPWTHNHVRMPLECLCVIRDADGSRQYALGTACKSEQVYVDRDVWHQPNADVNIILSDAAFGMTIKSWDHRGRKVHLHPPTLGVQSPRQVFRLNEAFDHTSIDVHRVEGAPLESAGDIVEAGLNNVPLVAQTQYTLGDGREVLIEYPVKCCNFGPRERYYQVDTGPILLPNPKREHEEEIESLELAYIAHNASDWAEVVVNVPTTIDVGVEVDHYAESRRLDGVVNRMIRID